MKNKIAKSIGVLCLASLMTTTAYSQITVSGYTEAGFTTGSSDGAHVNSKGLGAETVITIAGKGKLSNGWDYSAYQNIDSDDNVAGRATVVANDSTPLTTRAIVLSPNSTLSLFYTFDGVYGGEIARTAVPVVTERVADLTVQSGMSEFIDVTSGSNAVGFDLNNVGPSGRFSVAYNPNLDTLATSSSDRVGVVKTSSGYSVGYSVTPGPITIRAGLTKIDQTQAATAQDVDSKTLGVTYTQAPFAIGIQRTKNDGVKVATLQANNAKDEVDTVAASFALSKELTLGATYSKMEREAFGTATGGDTDGKTAQFVVAYNLGPVVVSGAYEDAKDKGTVDGNDTRTTKIKVKANF